MVRVLCLGMSALDAIYNVPAIPTQPTKVLATGFAECGGGMAANASVAVSRLGGAAHYWGRVGDDELGRRIVAQLAADRVDTSTVRRVADCVSPSAAILVAADGERLVLIERHRPGLLQYLDGSERNVDRRRIDRTPGAADRRDDAAPVRVGAEDGRLDKH